MELPVKQFQTRAEQAFVDLFAAAEQGLPGAGNPWVADLRVNAIDAYAALGLPHRRVEAWKYTDLRSKLTEALPLARATGVAWSADDEACEAGRAFLLGMVAPEYRGKDSGFFDDEVAVDDTASALDRLLGFAGRNPSWTPA